MYPVITTQSITTQVGLDRSLTWSLFFAGNMRGGLAVGKTILSGYNAAERVIAYLERSGGRKIFTMASAK